LEYLQQRYAPPPAIYTPIPATYLFAPQIVVDLVCGHRVDCRIYYRGLRPNLPFKNDLFLCFQGK
jgi:hypothetical protein